MNRLAMTGSYSLVLLDKDKRTPIPVRKHKVDEESLTIKEKEKEVCHKKESLQKEVQDYPTDFERDG